MEFFNALDGDSKFDVMQRNFVIQIDAKMLTSTFSRLDRRTYCTAETYIY